MKYDLVIYGMSAERERLLRRVMGSFNRWGEVSIFLFFFPYFTSLHNFHLYVTVSFGFQSRATLLGFISFGNFFLFYLSVLTQIIVLRLYNNLI